MDSNITTENIYDTIGAGLMVSRTKLSISEFTILGIIWSHGPCTTYLVMRVLASSPTTFYRNRAATAYRAVQRLVREGLAEAIGDSTGPRHDRLIRISDRGVEALQSWLSPPLPLIEVSHTIDLIRLRMYFVGVVEVERRASFVDDAIDGLRKHLKTVEANAAKENETDPYAGLAALGTVYETRARIEWLEAIKPKLAELGN